MKKISVIIPCYNGEKYIEECFASLKRQTIGIDNLEIIFVNDASTDNSLKLMEHVREEYPSSVRVENLLTNHKQGGARNVGISVATGEYIAFLDADDWVDDTMYQKCYDIVKQYDIEILQYPMQKYYDGMTRIEDPAPIKGLIILEDEEMQKMFLAGQVLTCGSQTKLYKRAFLEKVTSRFIEGYVYEEPSFVYPLLLYAKRVYCMEEPLYYYRMHEESTMHQYVRQEGKLYDHAVVQLNLLRDIKNREDVWNRFRDEIVYYFILTYFIETIYFAGSCNLKLDVTMFHQMQETVKKEVPEYKRNPYLQKPAFDFREYLLLLEQDITQEELDGYCAKIGQS